MQRATITLHLPTHRRESIKAYGESWRMLDRVYDGHIGDYVEFLRQQARDRGFEVRTDRRDVEPAFSIAERDREQKKKAHQWLEQLPDLWEWLT